MGPYSSCQQDARKVVEAVKRTGYFDALRCVPLPLHLLYKAAVVVVCRSPFRELQLNGIEDGQPTVRNTLSSGGKRTYLYL